MKTIKIYAYALAITSGFVLTSCGSDDSDGGLPPIGGYDSADEVAAADLLAYWPLDGNGEESVSGAMPSNTVNATWVQGKKGQAVSLAAGFLDYATITNLTPQNGNFTVSCWAKVSNTKPTAGAESHISPVVSFTGGPNANVGNLAIFGNTHGLVSSDSIEMKAEYHFQRPDGTEFGGDCINITKLDQGKIDENNASTTDIDHAAFPNKIGGQWAHIVFTWEASTGTARLYVNGVKISNPRWEIRNQGNPMPMAFFTPTHPIIGALNSVANGTSTDGWNKALTGQVDEIRVFKKMLIQADISALYQLESAGR